MSEADEAARRQREQFEQLGVNQVRALTSEWSGDLRLKAMNWLSEKDQELARVTETARVEQLEIDRLAKEAAFEANRLASEANSIARDAAASASAAAAAAAANTCAAHTNNMIATLALIAAIIAIAISVLGIFIKH